MNRWYQIRRMRGAAFLILVGVLALLNQWNILHWDRSWPFFLIVAGSIALAEHAARAADIREQQAAQGLSTPIGLAGNQPSPHYPASPSDWSGAPPNTVEPPFIQAHPPASEDPGREDR